MQSGQWTKRCKLRCMCSILWQGRSATHAGKEDGRGAGGGEGRDPSCEIAFRRVADTGECETANLSYDVTIERRLDQPGRRTRENCHSCSLPNPQHKLPLHMHGIPKGIPNPVRARGYTYISSPYRMTEPNPACILQTKNPQDISHRHICQPATHKLRTG